MRCCELFAHHTPVIVHGDLTPGNVLIEKSTLRPKLIDFGLSRRYGKADKMTGGTHGWMAPEVLAAKGSSNKVSADPSIDVFSIGALTFFIATGLRPFAGFSKAELIQHAKHGELPGLQWPESEVCWLEQCKELTKRCTSCVAAARPSIEAIHAEIEAWLPESSLFGPSGTTQPPRPWLAGLADVRHLVRHPRHMQPGHAAENAPEEPRHQSPQRSVHL